MTNVSKQWTVLAIMPWQAHVAFVFRAPRDPETPGGRRKMIDDFKTKAEKALVPYIDDTPIYLGLRALNFLVYPPAPRTDLSVHSGRGVVVVDGDYWFAKSQEAPALYEIAHGLYISQPLTEEVCEAVLIGDFLHATNRRLCQMSHVNEIPNRIRAILPAGRTTIMELEGVYWTVRRL